MLDYSASVGHKGTPWAGNQQALKVLFPVIHSYLCDHSALQIPQDLVSLGNVLAYLGDTVPSVLGVDL